MRERYATWGRQTAQSYLGLTRTDLAFCQCESHMDGSKAALAGCGHQGNSWKPFMGSSVPLNITQALPALVHWWWFRGRSCREQAGLGGRGSQQQLCMPRPYLPAPAQPISNFDTQHTLRKALLPADRNTESYYRNLLVLMLAKELLVGLRRATGDQVAYKEVRLKKDFYLPP